MLIFCTGTLIHRLFFYESVFHMDDECLHDGNETHIDDARENHSAEVLHSSSIKKAAL